MPSTKRFVKKRSVQVSGETKKTRKPVQTRPNALHTVHASKGRSANIFRSYFRMLSKVFSKQFSFEIRNDNKRLAKQVTNDFRKSLIPLQNFKIESFKIIKTSKEDFILEFWNYLIFFLAFRTNFERISKEWCSVIQKSLPLRSLGRYTMTWTAFSTFYVLRKDGEILF